MSDLSDLNDAVPRSTRLPSVRSMLAWIVVACLLPATIGIGALVCYLYRDGHAQLYKETLQSTRALTLLVDDELDLAKTAAEMLATASDLRRANWPALHARAKALLETRNIGRNAIVSDINGQQIANTSVPFGTPLPMFGDPEHLRRVVASGKPAISGLFSSALTGRNMVSISVPAFVNGKVAYIISVGIPGQQLNEILERRQLPAQWVAGIVDNSGSILAYTHDRTQFIGKKTTAAFMQRMRATAPDGMFDLTTLDGTPSLALYSRSALSGWGVVIAIPRASLTAQLMRTLAFFGLGISLLFGAGTALALFMGGRISRSIAALKAGADAMGTQLMETQSVSAVSTIHFREADDLAQAMRRSASTLGQRTQALQASLAALETSEESYRILIEGSPDAILLHQDGKVLSVNPAFVMFAGNRSAQQWVGKSILDSVDPAFHQAVLERMTQLDNVDARAMLPISQITCLKVDGTPFRVEIQSVCVDYQGRRAVHTTLRDISERQRAEAERMAEALFHRQLLEQLPIGVALCMLNGDFIDVNPAFANILGLPREQVAGMTNDQISTPQLRERDAEQSAILQRTGHYGPVEKEYLRPDGSRVSVRVRGQHVRRNGEMLILSVAEDISDQRKAEFHLAQTQKMDAIGQLTGGLAHDFNNMLGVIIGNLDLLSEELADGLPSELGHQRAAGRQIRSRIDTALMAALGGADLTRALLSVARTQAVVTEPVDLNARLNELLPLLRHTAGPNIELVMALTNDSVVVQVDSGGLAASLLNLVINARDAMQDGGWLTLATQLRTIARKDIATSLAPGQYALLSVIDTGCGMSADVMANAMLPFFTTKERGRGTGLGIPMAHGFVKQCGGELLLHSEPGHGTTVTLSLPLADAIVVAFSSSAANAPTAEMHVANRRGTAASTLARGSERVLVVDDEIELLAVTARWLNMLGYDVTPCTNATSALSALSDAVAQGQPYALLVSDVIMPGIDGFALAHSARAQQPDLVLLYVSGFADAPARGRDRPYGAILEKPFRQAELATLVRRALDRQIQQEPHARSLSKKGDYQDETTRHE